MNPDPSAKKVFISYRRDTGAVLARLFEAVLDREGYLPFLDVNSTSGGHFDRKLLQEIESARHFLLICTGDALHRIRLEQGEDWVRQEIAHALKHSKNIIGVRGFDKDGHLTAWPGRKDLPDEIFHLATFNALSFSHEHWEDTKKRLLDRLQVTAEQIEEMHGRPEAETSAQTKEERRRSADAHERSGQEADAADDTHNAKDHFTKAMVVWRRLAEDFPSYENYDAHARCCERLARVELKVEAYDNALSYAVDSRRVRDGIAADRCTLEQCKSIVTVHLLIVHIHRVRGNERDERNALGVAADHSCKNLDRAETSDDFRILSEPLQKLSDADWESELKDESLETSNELLEHQSRFLARCNTTEAIRDRCSLLDLVARRERAHGAWKQCLAHIEDSIELRRSLAHGDDTGAARGDLCQVLELASEIEQAHLPMQKALERLFESLAIRRSIAESAPATQTIRALGSTLALLARAGACAQNWDANDDRFPDTLDAWCRLVLSGRANSAAEIRDLLTIASTIHLEFEQIIKLLAATTPGGPSNAALARLSTGFVELAACRDELKSTLEDTELKPNRNFPITKSQFKLGLNCIQKLRHARAGLPQNQSGNDVLRMLSEGGAAVEALQRAIEPGAYTGGIGPDAAAESMRHVLLALQTVRDGAPRVSLYEVTIMIDGFLARIDLLRVMPDRLELVELKAKTKPVEGMFTRRGGIRSAWLPYMQDIGFQHELLRQWVAKHHEELGTRADLRIDTRVLLVDSSGSADAADILSPENFRTSYWTGSSGMRRTTVEYVGKTPPTSTALLCELSVDAELEAMHRCAGSSVEEFQNRGIAECMSVMRAIVDTDTWPSPTGSLGRSCRQCEYRVDSPERSGFARCWGMSSFSTDHVAELVRVSDSQFVDAITAGGREASIADLPEAVVRDTQLRQWRAVISKRPVVDQAFAADPIACMVSGQWDGPIWFLDFETSAYPIPGRIGGHPYEHVPFQFEGHSLPSPTASLQDRTRLDGFLDLEATDPRRDFIDQLRTQFTGDGPIFHWHIFERIVLNRLRASITAEPPTEGDTERVAFIDSLVGVSGGGGGRLVDLMPIAQQAFYHPNLRGSYSIKRVVPIAWAQPAIRAAFIQGHGVAGDPDWCSGDTDPYDGLPAPSHDLLEELGGETLVRTAMEGDGGDGVIHNGGMAMLAYHYARTFEGAGHPELRAQLRRYCGLDSAAMVMVYGLMRDVVGGWNRD